MAALGRGVATTLLRFSHLRSVNRHMNTTACVLGIKSRWVAPYRKELFRRQKKMEEKGLTAVDKRSNYIEWNYDAELYAFGQRLQEEFVEEALREALMDASYIQQEIQRQQDLGVTSPALAMTSNAELAATGSTIVTDYCTKYLRTALPLFPEEGIIAITEHLTSEEVLSEVGYGIGLKDLILCQEHPPVPSTACRALQAVVGAISISSGIPRAHTFVRDFVITQLVGKDVNAIWKIKDPMDMLAGILRRSGRGDPDPRLIFQSGVNTIQAVFHVGVYSDKQFIGSGYGETISEAREQAAYDALRRFFQTTNAAPPMPFGCEADILKLKDEANLSVQDWSVEKARNIVTC